MSRRDRQRLQDVLASAVRRLLSTTDDALRRD